MNNFLKVQLNRACYVSLLKANEIVKGIEEYRVYIRKLNLLSINPFLFIKCFEEKKKAKSILIEKLEAAAEKYQKEDNLFEAQKLYKIIYELDSKNYKNIKNYISCLEKLGQLDIALVLAEKLAKSTKKPDNYKLLADMQFKNNLHVKSIISYDKAMELAKTPYDVNDYTKMGCYYFNLYGESKQPKDIKNSFEYFKKALQKEPNNKACIKNLISAAGKAKYFEVQHECWEKYLELGEMDKEEEFSYAANYMLRGDVENWAKHYESRYENLQKASGYLSTSKPRYDGSQDISDKTLLVFSEQGFGDTILMYGYLKRLVKIAKKVIFHVQDPLYELFKNNDLGIEVYSSKLVKHDSIDHDYFILCMSIPKALKLNKQTVSVEGGYLKPDKELVEKYRQEYFNNDKLKIGVAFLGNPKGPLQRDIPIKKLAILDKIKNAQFYCFSKDVDDKSLKAFRKNKIINIAPQFENFAQTAAAMENVDIMIASDNGMLNLAGAIGKKTFGMFNYHYEFRWYDLTGEDCGWFKNVKPIVNNEFDDWEISLLKVVDEINKIKKGG
ncbi:hypothetical protein IJ425_08630 [bacterium]|nr:hypothetical protein [bacterium]